MKHISTLTILAMLTLTSLSASATPETQKVKDATAIWLAAIEPGVTPKQPKKYKAVKKARKKGQAQGGSVTSVYDELMSDDVVVPGTNMSAMILDKLKVSEQITPETTALFGETIDLNTGAVSLQQVDISIPGNFNIPVEFRRIFKGANYAHYSNLNLGEWNIGIPSISTTVIYDHITYQRFSGNWGSGNMCSGQLNPGNFAVGPNQILASGDYWSGETLDIPGVISEKVQVKYQNYVAQRFIKNWRFACTTVSVNGTTIEGLKATSPEGVTYEFTQPKLIPTTPMSAANGLGFDEVVAKYHAFLLVSKITDRFGNTVNYNYTDGQLSSISSPDGRQINIAYETNTYGKKRVSSMTANGQTWTYRYQNATHPSNNDSLIEVERPDGKKWQLSLAALNITPGSATQRDYYYHIKYNPEGDEAIVDLYQIIETQCLDLLPATNPAQSAFLVHPNGARLDLSMRFTRFGRSQVPKVLSNYSGYPHGDVHTNDLCFVTNSLVQKTLSGPGLSAMSWQYAYSQNKGSWNVAGTGEQLKGLAATPATYNLMDLRSTSITTPDGAKTVHIFSRRWDHTDGQEVGTEYYHTDGSTLLRRIERKFAAVATGGSVEMTSYTGNELGTAYLTDNPTPHENYINKTSEKVISYTGGVAGDSFTTEYPEYNSYGLPTKTVENNSLGVPERTMVTTYHQDTSNWVLNQESNRQISQGDKSYSERSATYYAPTDAEKSLPKTESRNGQLVVHSRQYNVDGTLKKTTYALTDRWVEFGSYKRGKPESIKLPNRYDTGNFTVSLRVNDTGTIAWAKDLNGNKTSYSYDNLNRLTLIDPEDSQWLNTSISYEADTSAVGALLQKITRGSYRKTITLDALMQPMLSKEWDYDDEADTVRYINQQFNAYGKATFTSVPSASSTENYGTSTTYDGLQRIVSQTNTANGDLSFSYGSNNSISVNNGKGHSTTTQYLAYGSPATDLAMLISQPEGVTTTISYNIANLPVSITQGDVTEERRYDSAMRLCLQKRPETGIKVLKYNLLGQVTDYAEGLSGSGQNCADYTDVPESWVTQTYDKLGDVWETRYPDGTATKTATLDRQGNLTGLVNGNNSWSYAYNSLNLPYEQSLSLDSKTYTIGLAYNNHGHLQSKTYGGATLTYAPNALGLPTQVADSQTYASGVLYHPSGQLKSYTYGNGLTFNQTLNAAFKPDERRVKSGSTNRMGQRYGYDDNDNLDAITDLVNAGQSISMTFDGLDRLDTASGVWGTGSFSYDSLGNLSSKVLGTQNLSYSYHSTSKRLNTVSGGYSFSYDDRGNVINNGKRAFQFNRANQLTSSGTISYQYDGHGRRVKKTGSSNGYSIYDLSGTLLLTDGPNGQTRYIHLGKELIAKKGSTAALEDKPGYTGHVEDKDLSLTYMQQRYYDPVIGRFYSNDPVGFTASNPMMFNRYAYANNNPYKYTDPNGRNPAMLIRPLPIAPPVGGNAQPQIPGHPGVPSSSGGSPSTSDVPIINPFPITSALVAIAQSVISGSDSSKEQKGQGQPEVGECPSCGGKTTDREGKIAQDHGMTSKEVKNSIHGLKNDANMPNNSNVEVCKDCGEVFPQGADGTLGDSIGNIKEEQQ